MKAVFPHLSCLISPLGESDRPLKDRTRGSRAPHGLSVGLHPDLRCLRLPREVILMAALKGPQALRGTICTTWPGHATLPLWSTSEEAGDGGSSMSSGCFSGSSGGHISPTLHHVPWRKQPPPSLRPKQQLRSRDTQLELLKAKIRSQARRQASYTSLGTSAPSSASYLYSSLAPTHTRPPCPTRIPTCTGVCPPGFMELRGLGGDQMGESGQGSCEAQVEIRRSGGNRRISWGIISRIRYRLWWGT